ncbi:MAG: glycosyltransferase family protein, partial [Proteobacteria bacterium]|nr:glycosyltransferase family protein [Pseudomonadota bacterium]
GFGLQVFRGSENNVLDRFFKAATMCGAKHIMRITADCPLIDPDLLDTLIEYYFANRFDYASNCVPPTLPDGLDAEIFTFEALEAARKNAVRPSCLEHVTPYIRNHPERFKIGSWSFDRDLSYLRWTVDEHADFQFVQQVIEKLYPVNKNFRTDDILNLLDQDPRLMWINAHIARNEGFLKSLQADKIMLNNQTLVTG